MWRSDDATGYRVLVVLVTVLTVSSTASFAVATPLEATSVDSATVADGAVDPLAVAGTAPRSAARPAATVDSWRTRSGSRARTGRPETEAEQLARHPQPGRVGYREGGEPVSPDSELAKRSVTSVVGERIE